MLVNRFAVEIGDWSILTIRLAGFQYGRALPNSSSPGSMATVANDGIVLFYIAVMGLGANADLLRRVPGHSPCSLCLVAR